MLAAMWEVKKGMRTYMMDSVEWEGANEEGSTFLLEEGHGKDI